MERQGGGQSSARLRCRARQHHAAGLFRQLADRPGPICRKEGKQTQPVSFVEKAGFFPAQAPMPLHMAEFVPKCKGSMLQCSKTGVLALPCPRDYHKFTYWF
ncbi:hypothetical protein LB553_01620 [Mesorhizobium sp. CA8]|uniref:hypothetical protein n=1 Tax=unclassified Mesorhizobium TaxID=325217 RepID=UPI001CCE6DED|nr:MULTISPECIES: hypothetical protein [unclassified Mesorhizobium]MBZ9759586.1 hypothetical protein [Mesorhizobium sp. CA8]MBZ9821768.1 hypothetical protein [Mesorhizobium sp. CA4]